MKNKPFSVIIHHNGGESVEEKEIVQLIQHYRHDVLNELQIVMGYLNIGKLEKVEEKLHDWIQKLNEERLLANLNIPKWTLWIMQLKTRYANIRLFYTIDIKSSLNISSIDHQLVYHSEQIIEWIYNIGDKNKLYDINITLKEKTNLSEIQIIFYINGFKDIQQGSVALGFPVRMEQTEDGLICEWSYLVQ